MTVTAYSKINVLGVTDDADPHALITMLMDGALQRIVLAKGALKHGEVARKGELISAAITIICGLKDCLNTNLEDELSNNLADLYDYMARRLMHANLHNDGASLNEVASLLREIKSAWEAIPPESRKLRVAETAALA